MAINIVDQFQVNTYLPIDNRFVVGTASMSTTSGTYSPFYLYKDDIPYKYPGLRIWDFNDGVPYVWTGLTWSNENNTGALVQNGGGHQNWIPKFINNSTLLGKSLIFDNGNNIGLGISTAPSFPTGATGGIHVQGWVRTNTGFVGNGTNLVNLNASNITLGSLNITRIAASIPFLTDTNYVLTSINGVNSWQNINTISPVIQGLNLPGGSGNIFSQLNNNVYEFRSLTSTGFDITQSNNNINLESKAGINIGSGSASFYVGLSSNKLHQFKSIKSNNLVISQTSELVNIDANIISDTLDITIDANTIRIEQPITTDIRSFIVNSAYEGTEELGTLAKPYKTIQKAITDYIGTGNIQTPQFLNSDIIIQKGSSYTFTGNFSFNMGSGSIILEEGTLVISNPSSNWLVDYDILSNTQTSQLNIVLRDNSLLYIQKNGFRNRGTSVSGANYTTIKRITFKGTGFLVQTVEDDTNVNFTLFESNFTANNTFNNDSLEVFLIQGIKVQANTQQFIKIGGNSDVVIENATIISGALTLNVSSSLVPFEMIGGAIRINNSIISLGTLNTRGTIFSLNKSANIPCALFIGNSTIFNTKTTNLFVNQSTNQSTVDLKNVISFFDTITNIATSPNVLWTNFLISNCIFPTGEINQTQVDLTGVNSRSTVNIIGQKVLESLQVYSSRANAVSFGLKKGNAFINRKVVNAPDLIQGVEYQVLTSGSPSLGTVGSYFIATGNENGSGTAYQYVRDVLI